MCTSPFGILYSLVGSFMAFVLSCSAAFVWFAARAIYMSEAAAFIQRSIHHGLTTRSRLVDKQISRSHSHRPVDRIHVAQHFRSQCNISFAQLMINHFSANDTTNKQVPRTRENDVFERSARIGFDIVWNIIQAFLCFWIWTHPAI